MNETPLPPALKVCFAFQGLTLLAGVLLPFRFDHPSWLGLDFDHFLLLLGVYLVTLFVGVIAALANDRPGLVFDQLGFTCAGLLAIFVKDMFF